MPIVVHPGPGGLVLGPGVPINWSSDFIGPLPTGSTWELHWFEGTEPTNPWLTEVISNPTVFSGSTTPFVSNANKNMTINVANTIRTGANAHVEIELRSPTGVLDSGTFSATWDTSAGIATQLLQTQGTVQGGFTAQDRVDLQTTLARTALIGEPGQLVVQQASGPIPTTLAEIFSRKALDLLTLDELTGGETGDPVRASLGLWFYGVIVRVTTIAEDLVPKTPDFNWYFPDLAVLRIFRGQDLEYRRGIHTPTFMVENPWQWGWGFLNENPILGVPPDTTVAVDWRLGCAGQVFVQRLP